MIYYDNLIFALQKAGGISTYWGELITRLLRDKEEVLFKEMSQLNNLVRGNLEIDNSQIIQEKKLPKVLNRFCSVDVGHTRGSSFVFHSSYNRVASDEKINQVATIHDFVHEKFYSGLRKYLHSSQKRKSIMAASKIIVVSENTKRDLLELNPEISADNVKVIYNGVSEDFFRIEDDKLRANSEKYIVFVGSREKYKNFDFAVRLMGKLDDFKFYIVGSSLNKLEVNLLNSYLVARWKLFTNIPNNQLNVIYNNAYALLYPSSYEGFGIPLLEAMKAGAPFIALNKSSIPEVAGDAGLLIDDLDEEKFNEAIASIKSNREKLIVKGFKQAEKFSWEKCYQETLSVYKELLKK